MHSILSKNEKLLLRACLYKNAQALEAYEGWKSSIDINELNHGEVRLFPLLYHNLTQMGMKDAFTEKYKGVTKRTWLFNQNLLHKASGLFDGLNKRSIPFCLLKGGAMALSVYKDLSLRPMDDIDLLISKKNVSQAASLLNDLGFHSMIPDVDISDYFDFRHSLGFRNDEGFIIDLHCYILEDCCGDGELHPFYDLTVGCSYKDREIQVPQPTEHLFHTIVHGMRWNPTSSVRWVSDSCKLIEAYPIKWNKLLEYAISYQLVLPVKEALNLLRSDFGQKIPEDVMVDFEMSSVTDVDQEGYRFHLSPYNSFIPSVRHHWNHYIKTSDSSNRMSFLEFCKRYWGVKSFKDLIRELFKKVQKKIRFRASN